MPTPKQIDAAFNAWEKESHKWVIRESGAWWLVEPRSDIVPVDGMSADDFTYHRFDKKSTAHLFVRDKIIRAILTAVEAV